MVKKVSQLIRDLVAEGGAVVTTDQCHEIEIADARLTGRMAVRDDGIGFVRRTAEWLAAHKTCKLNEEARATADD